MRCSPEGVVAGPERLGVTDGEVVADLSIIRTLLRDLEYGVGVAGLCRRTCLRISALKLCADRERFENKQWKNKENYATIPELFFSCHSALDLVVQSMRKD